MTHFDEGCLPFKITDDFHLDEGDDELMFDEGNDDLLFKKEVNVIVFDEDENALILEDEDALIHKDSSLSPEEKTSLFEEQLTRSMTSDIWKVMIVDDEKRVHDVTRYALHNFSFNGKGVKFLSAYSGEEANTLVEKNPDTAIILLDVVMETNHAGLKVARYIRKVLQNQFVRIILRTGQPGQAPEKSVILDYDINDYKTKTELTHQKLFTTMVAALRSYQDLITIENNRIKMKNMNERLHEEITKRQEKDKFFSIIAHDLTNPFQPLLGLSQLLAESATIFDPEDIEQLSNSVYRSARIVYELLKNLLQWSRMERGLIEVQPFVLALYDIADKNVELLEANATHKNVALRNEVTEKLMVLADENMIDTIIRNLISNAIKFTPPGGSITVSTLEQDGFVEISITDTGIGIPKENLDNLFKIDVNTSTEGTDGEMGTGLGLIMCKEMVEKNGGRIWVESEMGKGTSVKFTMPVGSIVK